ncbi:hypothetical protein ABTC85_20650, partial [Acinetobacter baumannii]
MTFTWVRRSRVPGADSWGAGDAPLGEDTEAYQLRILSGATTLRTIAATSPTCIYPAAQQLADFGTLQSS